MRHFSVQRLVLAFHSLDDGPYCSPQVLDKKTYKAIMAYAQSSDPTLTYHKSAKELTKEAKEFIEDLLDPDPEQRLGCRGGGFEEIEVHAWLDGFKFEGLADGSLDAPFQNTCTSQAAAYSLGLPRSTIRLVCTTRH